MSKHGFVAPNVKDVPLKAAVDRIGRLEREIARRENMVKALKSRLGSTTRTLIVGDEYRALIAHATRMGYSAEKLRKYVKPEVLKKCVVKTPYVSVTVNRRKTK